MRRLRARELAALALALAATACGGGGSRAASAPAATPGPPATPAPAGFTLVFSDEFEAPGALDPAKWGYEIGYVRNDEKQYYTSRLENVRAEGGMLVIEGRKESYQGYGYTSASVNTLGRFALRYGRVEVRAKLPSGRGTWPAIWMLGTNIARAGWPACGEIDIMENVGFDPLRVHASVHTAAYNHTIGTQKTASTLVADPAADFHVYAMEWYPDRIEGFVDGARYFSFRNEGSGSRTWPFDEPQYLLINLALGGAWGGQQGLDDSRFPHRYLVDYVRIYQQS
ncbi:MAG: family 16 glycosylhydrolase [Burkholderiales bacterium]|jgi:beta-glucanase (GH16 family)